METFGDKIKPKISQISAFKFYCINCDYGTSKKSNYDSHIISAKHSRITNGYYEGPNSAKIQPNFSNSFSKSESFICSCGKEYKHRQGLWRHHKICNIASMCNTESDNVIISNNTTDKEPNNSNEIQELKEIMKYLMKENSEMKNIILEVVKNGTNTNNNNNITHTNSHNKAFNLNFFLNETCKDAMNIMDFVESIKLQVSDLESVGELGYVEGISNIIVKNLNALDVTQRPVHCTDKKRETIYIKDDNKWEKDEERKMMHKMIKKVADKNARLLPKFTEKYPDYKNYHSKNSDKYSKIIVESMGGSGDNDYEKEEKIIKNIAKNIVVEK
jgi:hypothetical protein